jgi:hypothetical protein
MSVVQNLLETVKGKIQNPGRWTSSNVTPTLKGFCKETVQRKRLADESERNGQLGNPLSHGFPTVINIAAIMRM